MKVREDKLGWKRGWEVQILLQKNRNLWKVVEEQKESTKRNGEIEGEKEEKEKKRL